MHGHCVVLTFRESIELFSLCFNHQLYTRALDDVFRLRFEFELASGRNRQSLFRCIESFFTFEYGAHMALSDSTASAMALLVANSAAAEMPLTVDALRSRIYSFSASR